MARKSTMTPVSYLKDRDCDPFRKEKAQLMRHMLKHVPRYGWTVEALRRAAIDVSVSDAELIFASARAYDYVCAAFELGEQRLAEDFLQASQDKAWQKLPVREKIAYGVRRRLEPWTSDRAALRRAVPIAMQPQHLLHTMRYLYETLDKIWRAAGDRSVDHNFYTKRAVLALVYLPTFFFWLTDRSERCYKTWAFLDKRIDEALRLGRRLSNPWKNPWKNSGKTSGETSGKGRTRQEGGKFFPDRLRLAASLLRATFVKGKMHAKP